MAVVTTDPSGRVERESASPGIGELAGLLAGRTFAAHHAALGLRFVAAEFGRGHVPMPAVPVLCTCEASRIHLPDLARRRLRDCCAAAGVEWSADGALDEARATAGLLGAYLSGLPGTSVHEHGPAACGVLAALLDDLPLADTLTGDAPAAAGSYLELVAVSIEKGRLVGSALAEHGRAVGIGRDELDDLNRGLVLAMARTAVAGGAVAEAVRDELVAAGSALGVPAGAVQAILAEAGGELIETFGGGFRPLPPDWGYGEPLRAGQSVAFTGGEPYRRSRLELAAQLAGLRVVNSVSAHTAVLVSGHPRPRSPKGVAAQRAGTRIVTPKVFERLAACVQPAGPAAKAVTAATVRAWARANGHLVGPRGRLPQHVHDAFHAAQRR
ncbi:hypothetical protein Adu01nite_60290 [Paractinoplanes durhamensis]|uniref:Lsr2 DNA-binding domain-containing protein n=2 Tax=Paractinoplanes durhamensis TaxID=113563 RepID=A0ABQ3Z546_9ACTN|nr:hypothetical protein Adu01nite_60290 [Actinoplanes durhamensis]